MLIYCVKLDHVLYSINYGMSDQGFFARRGVLELAMSIEACMPVCLYVVFAEGGVLEHPNHPPPPLYPPLACCLIT